MTRAQRHKEESSDYRYFPDPDLVPVIVTPEEVESVRSGLGELPAAIRQRIQRRPTASTPTTAQVIVNQGRAVVDYFDELAQACGDGKRASNWVQQDVLRTLNERDIGIESLPVSASALAELIQMVDRGDIDSTRARDVFAEMAASGASAPDAMRSLGIEQLGQAELVDLCRQLLAGNPKIVGDLKEGKMKAIGALIGQAKNRNPNANPNAVRSICLELIKKL